MVQGTQISIYIYIYPHSDRNVAMLHDQEFCVIDYHIVMPVPLGSTEVSFSDSRNLSGCSDTVQPQNNNGLHDIVVDMDDGVDVPCNVEDLLVCVVSSTDDVKTLMTTNLSLI